MPTHFQAYISSINRVRRAELLDILEIQARILAARPSLVVNPITGAFYGDGRITAPVANAESVQEGFVPELTS